MNTWKFLTGKYNIQYNPVFHFFGEEKLNQIAERVIEEGASWDSPADCKTTLGTCDGVSYLAFFMMAEDKRVIIIETQERLESKLELKLKDVVVRSQVAQDGTHRHSVIKES